MTFDELWPMLAIPGEFDAMDAADKTRWRNVIRQAFKEGAREEREWRCAVENELATMESTCASYATPRDAIRALIDWHVFVALSPEVSSDAEALIERGRREAFEVVAKIEREACARIADQYVKTSLITMAEQIARDIRARGEGK